MLTETAINTKKWIAQSDEADNALAILKNLIRLWDVKITDTSLQFCFENNPDYPSLSAINETLQKWDFETYNVKIKASELSKVVLPAVAFLAKEEMFVIITEVTPELVTFLDPSRGWVKQRMDVFCNSWNGIVLMASPGDNSYEQNYEQLVVSEKRRKQNRVPIDCIYILSLNHTEESKSDFLDRLADFATDGGTTINFFKAVDGKKVTAGLLDELEARLYPNWKIDNSPNRWWNVPMKEGEVGCALSHYLIWKDAFEKRYKTILILEEDFLFVSDNFSALSYNHPWELFYLGRRRIYPDVEALDSQVVVPDYSYCTYAYVLNQKGIDKLVQSNFQKNLIPVDEFLSAMFCDHPRRDLLNLYNLSDGPLQTLAAKNNIVVQNAARASSTENTSAFSLEKITRDLLLHKELCPVTAQEYEGWVNQFVNPLLVQGNYDLIVDEVAPHVFKFPLFSPHFCKLLIEEAEYRNLWTGDRHKNYPTYDITFERLGLQNVYAFLINKYVMPLAMHFWRLNGNAWTHMRSENFVVKYTVDNQAHLSLHHDGCEITLNVCLNNEFTGAGTVFPKDKAVINLTEPGYALIHPGGITHLHGARPIVSGKRYISISFLNRLSHGSRHA